MHWTFERLAPSHAIAAFDCGEPALNAFLQKHALNNDRAGLGATFVAVDVSQMGILGYFTLSAGSVRFDIIPDHAKRRLPKYPIPTVHIGRLAVDLKCQGQRPGESLLVEALCKAANASISVGVYAVDVIALHEKAKNFYLKYGFVEMLDQPFHLFMSMSTARRVAKIVAQ
jgi:GNAT superfamily N-acetyltransferase